jgi:D-alanine-D-alanine ligase
MTEQARPQRITIMFGGLNKERLVSVASAQALHSALPDADLWFWDADDRVYETSGTALLSHDRPFEDPFKPGGSSIGVLTQALDKAQAAKRFAAIAGVPIVAGVALNDMEAALAEYGKLIAKPARDGSSYGLMFVNAKQDLVAVRNAAKTEDYVIEPFVAGVEATCAVLEQADGSLIALPPIEIIPADGGFDYEAKYLAKSTQEICPGRFTPEVSAGIMDFAVKAHRAMSCRGYSRSDFIVSAKGPVYLETNTLPGLTKASLYPKALNAQGISFVDFLNGQIELAVKRAGG